MIDRLSSCSVNCPKSRTSIKVKRAQLPVDFVVGLHFQTQCIIMSEKMDGVSQNYFCKTANYTQNFHYKEGEGGKGKKYFGKEYSIRLLRIQLYKILRYLCLSL